MGEQHIGSSNPFGFTDQEKWHLDEMIMQYWSAKDQRAKKTVELDCYKQFKWMGFKDAYIDYLKENDCHELAEEMRHFSNVFHKAPHEHEKQIAA